MISMLSNRHKVLNAFQSGVDYSTRVRFAPSPTGLLHVGGLKTALINFLFAKNTNGKLILRIEDTDQLRYNANSVDHILKSLKWFGITFDEGVANGDRVCENYFQSNRLPLYQHAMNKLLKENKVYHCFCSNDRLQFLRQEQVRRGETGGYDRRCLNLSKKEIDEKLLQQLPYTIRLKLAEQSSVNLDDHIFGNITIPLSKIESDPVLMKSDGYPVYHFANVVDDHEMEISHVIRGQEWLVSTPKHAILYKALGWEPPIFAHLPLVVKSNGLKISKRDPDFSTSFYDIDNLIRKGFTRDSVIAWIMSSGGGLISKWHPSITLTELIEKFSLSRISTHNATLDQDILKICGRSHIININLTADYFDKNVYPFLQQNMINLDYSQFQQVFSVLKNRLECFEDITNFSYIWSYLPVQINDLLDEIDENNIKVPKTELIETLINRVIEVLETKSHPKSHLDQLHTSLCTKAVAMKCLRMIIINQTEGPRMSELFSVISKEEILRRLNLILTNIQLIHKEPLTI